MKNRSMALSELERLWAALPEWRRDYYQEAAREACKRMKRRRNYTTLQQTGIAMGIFAFDEGIIE